MTQYINKIPNFSSMYPLIWWPYCNQLVCSLKISFAQIDHHNKHIYFKNSATQKCFPNSHSSKRKKKNTHTHTHTHIFIQGLLILFHAQQVIDKRKTHYVDNNSNQMQQHNITNEMHNSNISFSHKNIQHVHVMIKLFKHTIDSNIDNTNSIEYINYIDYYIPCSTNIRIILSIIIFAICIHSIPHTSNKQHIV